MNVWTRMAILSATGILLLTGCSPTPVEPIPGSLIYNGQPRTKLVKSPVGSTLTHRFPYRTTTAEETYVLQPDRTLKLVRRQILPNFPPDR